MQKVFLNFFLFFVSCLSAIAQSHNFKLYTVNDGVPQSQIHAIIQDRKGFMWFGSDGGGLAKYDGKKFTLFTTTEGLCNDLVYSIVEAQNGKLWLGTIKGISILNGTKFDPVPDALKPLNDLIVRCILIDSKNKIYFGTDKGAFVFDGKQLIQLPELKDKNILCIVESKKGNHYFGTTGKGLFFENNGTINNLTTENGLNNNTVSSLLFTPDGKFYIGTDNGINVLKDATLYKLSLPAPVTAKQIMRSFYLDNEQNLWAGTFDCGLFKITGDTIIRYGKSEGLPIDGVFCTTKDKEGNLWIGTDGLGVAVLGPEIFTSVNKLSGMPDDMILSILKDSKGNWWYGNSDGVTKYDGKVYTQFNSKNGLSDEKVWSIIEDHDQNIWITTYGSGIFKYDGKHFTNYNEKNGLSNNNVRAVFEDSKKRIWAGTANGLNLFDGKFFKKINSGTIDSKRFICFFEDKEHQFWVGSSSGGLAKEIKGTNEFKCYNAKAGMADNGVLCVDEDKDGTIWTSHFGGISKLDPKTGVIKKITKKDGLSSNTVYVIKFTSDHMLLAGTNNGIDKIDVDEFNRSGKVVLEHFGKDEGFGGEECNTNSILKDMEGKIYFGTINGVYIYDPSNDRKNNIEPLTHITGLRHSFEAFDFKKFADNDSINDLLPAHISLPYNINHLTFDFIGLSYTISKKVKYRYMMEGFDQDWTAPISETFATYSNLPPGDYTFKVIAYNNDGIANKQPATFSFSILPPFWKTWWFRIAMVLAFILSIYGFFKYRLRRLHATQEMLKEQVALKTQEVRAEKELVESQNKLIEKKNQSITSSIHYAKRIQDAILPMKEKLNELMPESFVLFKPKDIVSGDFYWFTKIGSEEGKNEKIVVAAVDCTGHGVPGAFMSLIGNNLLNNIVVNKKASDPKKILEKLHEGVVLALKKGEQESGTVDGMDITLCVIDLQHASLEFASTGRSLLMVNRDGIKKYKVGKHPVGLVTKKDPGFEKEKIQLEKGDTFYIFTDGYCDQFGGTEDDKFLESNFEKLLLEIKDKGMNEQSSILENTIDKWKGKTSQLDDILVIGLRF